MNYPLLDYPSPPPTNSHKKKNIPLPLHRFDSAGALHPMCNDFLLSHAPISPPNTHPTLSRPLPDTNLLHVDSHSPQEVLCNRLLSQDTDRPLHAFQLLSPLSPDWSDVLEQPSPLFSRMRDHWHDGWCSDPSSFAFRSPPQSPLRISLNISTESDDPIACAAPPPHDIMKDLGPLPAQNTVWQCWIPPLSTPPLSPVTTTNPDASRPFLPLLEIPGSYHHHDGFNTVDHTDNDPPPSPGMDVDDGPILQPLSLFSPPPATDITLDQPPSNPNPISISSLSISPPPSPPLTHQLQLATLPDLDDPLEPSTIPPTHSPSPSRRSIAPLPDLDLDEDPLFTPSQHHLLSLPGADTDDDLIPTEPPPTFPSHLLPSPSPSSSSSSSSTPHPFLPPFATVPPPAGIGSSLLLINDPNDIPPPRSPSPENFDLDVSLVRESDDPDLRRLFELRRKAVVAERAARQLEAQWLAQGAVHMRAEARRVRKREKERSREIGALLRLKLAAEAGEQQGQAGSPPKRMISSLSQLVARMMFRRNEKFRPLANRKSASAQNDYVKSSLSRSVHDGA